VNKQQISSQYFISHPNNEISQTAIDLLHTPFEFSPGWERREIFLNTQKAPELNFTEDSRSALLRFKLNKVKKVWKKNQERLKDLKSDDDFTKITKILKVQKKLSTMIEELAKELGTVVL
jgi:hypothetical protein